MTEEDSKPELAGLRAILTAMAGGDAGEHAILCGLLVEALGGTMTRLEQAAAAGDGAQIRFHAHTLRGLAVTAGLTRAGTLAEQLECGSRGLSPAEVEVRVVELRSIVDPAVRWLAPLAGR